LKNLYFISFCLTNKSNNNPNHKLIPLYCIVYNSLLHPSHNQSIQQTTPHSIIDIEKSYILFLYPHNPLKN
jgi:hypothetical protein